jgi:hypothetical protein
MVNPVHRVHTRWTGASQAVHRGPTVARTEGTVARIAGITPTQKPPLVPCGFQPSQLHRSLASGRSGVPKLAGAGAEGGGEWGARLRPHRSSGGAVATG